MPLVDRLAGIGDPETVQKLPVDYFWAHLYELSKGKVTQQAIIDRFVLDADEQIELTWLIGRYNAQPNATAKASFVELIKVIFYMAEGQAPGYTTNAEIVARIQAA